jgi:hypothetical protein
LRIQAQMPIRTITGTVTTNAQGVSDTDVSVSYGAGNKFYVPPAVGIIFNAQTASEHYVVSNSTATGFDLSVYHGTNQRVARDVTWTATGYGIG